MSEDDETKFTRREPPDGPEDWATIWLGVERSNLMWPVVRVIKAIADNWKLILVLLAIAVAAGGRDILKALGVPLP